MRYCARACSTRRAAIRKSRLFSNARRIKFCNRGSSKNSRQSMSAAAVLVALIGAELFGHDPLTGALGRSYFGISVQPVRSAAKYGITNESLLIQFAPLRR